QLRWKNGERVRSGDYQIAFPQLAGLLRDLRPRWTCPACRCMTALEDEQAESLGCSNCSATFPFEEIFRPLARSAPASDVGRICKPSLPEGKGFDLRNYALAEPLGSGGMGEVYRARDPALGRDLAFKVMRPNLRGVTEAEQRFLREARITGSLQHPGIVPI